MTTIMYLLRLARMVPGVCGIPVGELAAIVTAIVEGREQAAGERAREAALRQARGIAAGRAAAASSRATEEMMHKRR